jgi:pimeloyl-ACP methyl ester carboxylesterase
MRQQNRSLQLLVTWCALLAAALGRAAPGVSDVRAFHREGQTFITWTETGLPSAPLDATDKLMRTRADAARRAGVCYRIFRSMQPPATAGLAALGEAEALSCWNPTYYGANPQEKAAQRYIVREGEPSLSPGTGLYVHNPAVAGRAWYGVAWASNGVAQAAVWSAEPVEETVGPGVPVLQKRERVKDFNGVANPELHFYVRWDAPPNAAAENRANDYLVGVPPRSSQSKAPVALMLHCWGGSQHNGYGWWQSHGTEGTTFLIAPNQMPYDWWTGHHEAFWETRGQRDEQKEARWKQGKVYPYTARRLLSFLDWAATAYPLDLARVGVGGNSMGGSGAPMLALRYPERFAWCVSWVGVHNPNNTPQYKGGYESAWGRQAWALPFENGVNVWDHYNDPLYLRQHAAQDVGLIVFANGKNDLGIGWEQALAFFRALQETRQPHVFVWGLADHGQRAQLPAGGGERVLPINVAANRSLPAFSRCSLDDDPGTGTRLATPVDVPEGNRTRKDSFDGAPRGQANLHLVWQTADAVDTAEAWEMTLNLTAKTPQEHCTVDVTPRRCQAFKPRPGARVRWTNRAVDGMIAGSGEVVADDQGLATVPAVTVTKAGNRLVLAVARP